VVTNRAYRADQPSLFVGFRTPAAPSRGKPPKKRRAPCSRSAWTFVADARERARDPATVAAATRSRQPRDPTPDAIRPVYPLETLLGVGAVGVAGGAVAVARAAGRAIGGAILKQVLPKRPIPTMRITPDQPAAPSGQFDGAIQAARESSDPGTQLEGQVAQHIKDAGIDVIGFNKEFGPNASIGEIDVETPDAIIEVTLQKARKLTQIRELMGNPKLNPTGKPVILYAPRYNNTAAKAISDAGASVARTPQELINLLRQKGTP
jgi:hypothetical protein